MLVRRPFRIETSLPCFTLRQENVCGRLTEKRVFVLNTGNAFHPNRKKTRFFPVPSINDGFARWPLTHGTTKSNTKRAVQNHSVGQTDEQPASERSGRVSVAQQWRFVVVAAYRGVRAQRRRIFKGEYSWTLC